LRYFLLSLCFIMLAWSTAGLAEEVPEVQADGAEAWLVTFGPGDVYWNRFGHNAIWLREPAAGIDHSFNFGYFDFDQENFFLNFLRGRMLYYTDALPSAREFESYRQQNRSIRLQKLDLNPAQYVRLRDYLLNVVRPENRNYLYDPFLNNCSTRVRDALDFALNGALAAGTRNVTANLNYRDQTRRLTQMQYWYYLGLELVLGYPVDRPVDRWEEMFIPMVLASELKEMAVPGGEAGQSLVTKDMILFTSSFPVPTAEPGNIWYRYLLLGLLVTGIAWLSGKFMPPVWLAGLCNAWLLIGGISGLLLAFLWLFTDHAVASSNVNLLLFNPLTLVALVPVLNRFGAWVLAGGVAVSFILLLFPQHQYNLDVLALLAPVNLAVAAYFIRGRNKSIL
jgi:Domain of unknown function (DUF4105)